MTSNGKCADRYIYQIPYAQHRELCRILDRDMKWEELGGKYMKFDMNTIIDLRRDDQRGRSPTSQLLTMWGQQNHTIVQLFVLLSKMHHYQAMTVLKPLVDSRFHDLINEGEENISILFDKNDTSLPSSTLRQEENATDIAANHVTLPPSHSSDKNMNVWGDNLNRRDVPQNLGRNKLLLPADQTERKILNNQTPLAMSRNDNNTGNAGVPRVTLNSQSLDASPAYLPQPHLQIAAARKQTERKENNPALQERKVSCASDVSNQFHAESIPLISYIELQTATHGWDKKTIIGKGGFGTVFKGNWKNTLVAIKRIEQRGVVSMESHQAQMEQLLQELRILNSCRHDNILPLYGFSMDGSDPCLVYQFMPNGSLEDRLLCRQGTPPLSWIQRHNIALGTARGLQFLHGKPFIHGDVKSANILLDKNFEPRIGDFGLARDGPQGHYTHMKISRIHGTLAYLPIDFLRNKQLSTKVDTYSFGIVVFELATGLRAYDEKRPQKLLKDFILEGDHDIIELHDKRPGVLDHFVFDYMISLGKRCVNKQARERPEMEEVLKHLDARNCIVERVRYMTLNTQPVRSPVPPITGNPDLPHGSVLRVPASCSPLPHIPFHSPLVGASPLPAPFFTPQDGQIPIPNVTPADYHSSFPSSEESGAVISASVPPNNAVVPLLSALGTVDSKDSQDTTPSRMVSGSALQSRLTTSMPPESVLQSTPTNIPSASVLHNDPSTSSPSGCILQTRPTGASLTGAPSSHPEITAKGKNLICGDLSN